VVEGSIQDESGRFQHEESEDNIKQVVEQAWSVAAAKRAKAIEMRETMMGIDFVKKGKRTCSYHGAGA
jgi:hypothetical protein